MDTSKQIIHFSRFYPSSTEGGGCRRTAQIADALKQLDFAFVSSRDYPWDYKNLPAYQEYLKTGGLPAGYIDKWNPTRRDDVAFMHYVSWLWSKEVKDSPSLKLALVDDPLYFAPLVQSCALKGIPIVALCHNIESLSKSQLVEEYQLELLNYELSLMSLCALVVTISREETVLLQNLGIDTFFLPYYPVQDIRKRMERIREERKVTSKGDFLLIGTANNPPTMRGMEEMVKRWPFLSGTLGGAKLYVGGFGSEPLKDTVDNQSVIFKGAMSDEDLDKLLCTVKACVVYQSDGSGALTKICEFLLAGVPVLVNSHAARSYYHLLGVIEFADIDDLVQAVHSIFSAPIDMKTLEPPDAGPLLTKIRELVNVGVASHFEMGSFAREILSTGGVLAETTPESHGWKRMVLEMIKEHESKLKAERDAIAAERDNLAAERDAIAAHRDALSDSRDEIYHSLSWRLTAPLRYIGKFFVRRSMRDLR